MSKILAYVRGQIYLIQAELFFKNKKELTVCGLQYIDEMEMAKIKIEKFRCDNARENKKFTEKLSDLQKNYYEIFYTWDTATKWRS